MFEHKFCAQTAFRIYPRVIHWVAFKDKLIHMSQIGLSLENFESSKQFF